MKISSFVTIILIIAAVFFIFALMVGEVNDQYPTSSLNSSEYDSQYDYIGNINDTFFPIESAFRTIQDENAGWFSKLSEGITAIPYALLIIPQALFGSLVYGGNIMVAFFTLWNLPAKIITLGIVILLMWGVFKLVEFFNKSEI